MRIPAIARETGLVILLVIYGMIVLSPVSGRIAADGAGYYDYLPSIFIRKDISRNGIGVNELDSGINAPTGNSFYFPHGKFKVNKYYCGTAVMMSPFFAGAAAVAYFTGENGGGYSEVFHLAIYIAALFYLWLALIYFRKILNRYHISSTLILLLQILIVFSTSVVYYTCLESSFSHIYSLAAITAFLYYVIEFRDDKKSSSLIISVALAGLIFILRPVNVLVLGFIPFIAGSRSNFRIAMSNALYDKTALVLGSLIAVSLLFLQCLLWFLQTGDWILYSYNDEGFNLFSPEILNVLFSYRKGLFIYTPVLLLGVVGLIFLLLRRNYYPVLLWILPMAISVYVISSWHDWAYGSSYGMRPFIEFYPLFFIPAAMWIREMKFPLRALIFAAAFVTIPLNLIQTWQYKEYILHWFDMDKDKYHKVFLRTEEQFKGLVWKKHYDFTEWNQVDSELCGDFVAVAGTADTLYSEVFPAAEFATQRLHQLRLFNEFNSDDNAFIEYLVTDSASGQITHAEMRYLIQFEEHGLNKVQEGLYNFETPPLVVSGPQKILIRLFAQSEDVHLGKCRLAVYKWK